MVTNKIGCSNWLTLWPKCIIIIICNNTVCVSEYVSILECLANGANVDVSGSPYLLINEK